MVRIPCFFIEPTDQVSVSLRRYTHTQDCPFTQGYHNASVFLEKEPVELSERGYECNGTKPHLPHDDPRWPQTCECGYEFQEEDEWQRFTKRLYRRRDTGEEMTLFDTPAGAMWYAWWFDQMYVPQLEHVLVVKTPGGEWIVDGQASNCGMPEDKRQEKHHCWIIEGTPPNITVGKQGNTCEAGAGSIQCRGYHGFLRNGFLED